MKWVCVSVVHPTVSYRRENDNVDQAMRMTRVVSLAAAIEGRSYILSDSGTRKDITLSCGPSTYMYRHDCAITLTGLTT